ncbi:MAG: WG repeat-containing protein [Ruminococcus sp.]
MKPHTQTARKDTDSTPKKGMWLFVFFLLLIAGLGIAVSRFYAAKTEDPSASHHVSSVPEQDSCYIFQEESTGLYGLSDADGRIIAAAEWKNLSFIGDYGVAAVKQIGTESVMGVLDREGNVIVPFVYQDLSYVNNQILVGKLLHEDLYFYTTVLSGFNQLHLERLSVKRQWANLAAGNRQFFLSADKRWNRTAVIRLAANHTAKVVTMHCEHRVTAQRYPVEVWQMLGDDLSEFLKAYQRNDETAAAAFLSSDAISQLHPLIPKNKAEKWLVDWNSSIGISSQMIQDNTVFCTITVKRDTESAVLRVAFSTESTAGTLQITGLEILQEKAEKTEESSALETTADFVINDGGRDISANPFGSVQEE